MRDTFCKIHDLLNPGERRSAALLFGMMLVTGLLETIGVGAVMPFISVVANPDVVHTNPYLVAVHDGLGFTSANTFLIFLGAIVFVLVVGSLAFKALTHWVMARYAHMRSYTLSSRLLLGYLRQPYSFFLNRHSADLVKTVLSEVDQVISRALMPALKLVANAVVAAFLIILIITVDPLVATSAVAVLGGVYALIYFVLRRYISRIGAQRVRANRARFQLAQEALAGIKDVKILGLEEGYIRGFRVPAHQFSRTQANNQIIGEMPKFAFQALMFGGMLLLLVGLLLTYEGSLDRALPLVGLYAVAGSRLIPALEQVYRALTALRFGKPALDALHSDLVETEKASVPAPAEFMGTSNERVRLHKSIKLDHVYYSYPGAGQPTLYDLTLTVPAHTTVGLVGSTGAGKTTAVDLILSLLEPQRGRLLVDGHPVTDINRRAWQRNIGYVPQSIFLTDDTVAANIALGVPTDQLDHEAVERAAKTAELHEFVMHETPNGYATMVGERGVRLSGGQRQRIGIARAIYHDPDVLVLDEATSALDNLTERVVMDAVRNLGHRKTIIIIAHRLSTVRECDQIFLLDRGKLVAEGTYSELSRSSDRFRAMSLGIT